MEPKIVDKESNGPQLITKLSVAMPVMFLGTFGAPF